MTRTLLTRLLKRNTPRQPAWRGVGRCLVRCGRANRNFALSASVCAAIELGVLFVTNWNLTVGLASMAGPMLVLPALVGLAEAAGKLRNPSQEREITAAILREAEEQRLDWVASFRGEIEGTARQVVGAVRDGVHYLKIDWRRYLAAAEYYLDHGQELDPGQVLLMLEDTGQNFAKHKKALAKEIQDVAHDPVERFQRAYNYLAVRNVFSYSAWEGRLYKSLQGQGGNCAANTRLMLCLANAVYDWRSSEEWKPAIAKYRNHDELVLYNVKTGRVYDPSRAAILSSFDAPIYDPGLYFYQFLERSGASLEGMTANDFLLRAADRTESSQLSWLGRFEEALRNRMTSDPLSTALSYPTSYCGSVLGMLALYPESILRYPLRRLGERIAPHLSRAMPAGIGWGGRSRLPVVSIALTSALAIIAAAALTHSVRTTESNPYSPLMMYRMHQDACEAAKPFAPEDGPFFVDINAVPAKRFPDKDLSGHEYYSDFVRCPASYGNTFFSSKSGRLKRARVTAAELLAPGIPDVNEAYGLLGAREPDGFIALGKVLDWERTAAGHYVKFSGFLYARHEGAGKFRTSDMVDLVVESREESVKRSYGGLHARVEDAVQDLFEHREGIIRFSCYSDEELKAIVRNVNEAEPTGLMLLGLINLLNANSNWQQPRTAVEITVHEERKAIWPSPDGSEAPQIIYVGVVPEQPLDPLLWYTQVVRIAVTADQLAEEIVRLQPTSGVKHSSFDEVVAHLLYRREITEQAFAELGYDPAILTRWEQLVPNYEQIVIPPPSSSSWVNWAPSYSGAK